MLAAPQQVARHHLGANMIACQGSSHCGSDLLIVVNLVPSQPFLLQSASDLLHSTASLSLIPHDQLEACACSSLGDEVSGNAALQQWVLSAGDAFLDCLLLRV